MAVNYSDARLLDQLCYDLLEGDRSRSINRALINSAANGDPPYTREEAEANNIRVNTNRLSLTRILHDARSQYSNAMMQAGNYFTCKTDFGPRFKRDIWSNIVQREANRIYKENIGYFETCRSSIASLVLHGISPVVWENKDTPIPRAIGVEDSLIPSGTLLSFENLPFIVFRRSFTGLELQRATEKAHRDPGWNMPFVRRCMQWLDSQVSELVSTNWPETWAPEKWEEMIKESGQWYASDRCPTLDTFDIYAYVEATREREAGWIRRIILDSWSNPGTTPGGSVFSHDNKIERKSRKDKAGGDIDRPSADDFLFTSGWKPVAGTWQNIAAYQYADLSAVAPFRYHSVRSLGWMLYALCHLQNRMAGKVDEAVFEALMQYFKVKTMDDVQRALKLELANLGFIDDSLVPLPAAERWQPNAQMIELGIGQNQNFIDLNSKAWTQDIGSLQNKTEKTKFEVMAKIQAANALVAAGLNQSYQYKTFEYRENFRRLMRSRSRDPLVMDFRARCMRQGVPDNLLNAAEKWDIQSERMVGSGNQTLEMLVSSEIMQIRAALDPEPQRIALRDHIATLTKNPAKALELVPETPAKVTDATHDAELVFNALMNQVPCEPQTGINHIEHIGKMLQLLGGEIEKGKQTGMVKPDKLMGLKLVANYIHVEIQFLAQDEELKPLVKKFNDELAKLINEIKGFEQRLQQAAKAAQKQQQGNGQVDPQTQAKIAGTVLQAKTKAGIAEKQAASRAAQKRVMFDQKLRHQEEQHQADIAAKDLEAASNIKREQMRSLSEDDDQSEQE